MSLGAIGMSLLLLALELTLPPNGAALTLHSAKEVLFNSQHIPLLVASLLPPLFLSVSIRSKLLERASFGFTQHALYVPVYMLAVAGVFWICIAGSGLADSAGMHGLSSHGWLFTIESVPGNDSLVRAWDYWTYFDFSRVRWSAMGKATENIVLLVVIGVLNLPIYVPAMALSLDVPVYNMNHELFGHGISNVLAGAVGTVPNLVVSLCIPCSPERPFDFGRCFHPHDSSHSPVAAVSKPPLSSYLQSASSLFHLCYYLTFQQSLHLR